MNLTTINSTDINNDDSVLNRLIADMQIHNIKKIIFKGTNFYSKEKIANFLSQKKIFIFII